MNKRYALIIVLGILWLCPPAPWAKPGEKAAGAWQITGNSATHFRWQGTDGEAPGTATSDGETFREELSVYMARQLPDNHRLGLDFRARVTNDERLDDETFRLLYLRGYWDAKTHRTNVGDVAASFNPYVFSTALKGAKLEFSPYRRKGFQAAVVGGVQKASWQEVFSKVTNEQPDRWLGGVNTSYTFDAGQKVGLTLALVRDRINTGDVTRVQADGAYAANAGLETEWRFNRYLTLRSQAAFMEGTDNLREDQGYSNGHAIKVRLLTKPLPRSLRSNFTYEYVDPDFAPLVGSGAANRERIENDTSYHFNRQLKFRLTLKHSRDNLDHANADTQYINDGNFYCDYRPDFIKRGDIGLRLQTKSIDGNGVDQLQYEGETQINVRPKSGWRLGGAYIYSLLDDDAAGAGDQQIHTLRSTLGWEKKLGKESRFRATVKLDYRLVDETAADQSKIGGALDLGWDYNPYWSFDLALRSHTTERDNADDTGYGNYQFRADFHPWKDRTKTLRLLAEQRDYRSDSTTTDQTYKENIVEMSYIFSF